MPLLYQKVITRNHLWANRQVLFVFGDNTKRQGFRGQAAEMRGEPNAVGVVTKWEPNNKPTSFFTDDQYDDVIEILRRDLTPVFQALMANKIVVWPSDGIGTGLSRLPLKAPKIWETLEETRLHLSTL